MCMIGFHKWGLWSELITTSGDGHKMQFRECLACGKVKARDLGYCNGARSDLANRVIRPVGVVRISSGLGLTRDES